MSTSLQSALARFDLDRDTPPDSAVWQKLLAHLDDLTLQDGWDAQAERGVYEHLISEVPIEMAVFDPQGRYLLCNPEAIKSSETRAWIIGKDDFEYCAYRGFDRAVAEKRRERFDKAVETRSIVGWEERLTTRRGEVRYHYRNLKPIFDEDGVLQVVLGFGYNITERVEGHKQLEAFNTELEARVRERTQELEKAKANLERLNEQLQHDAFHDTLTTLPNRALFKDRLGQAIGRQQRRPDNGFAVLFLDFDRFKAVNDSLGHSAGDALLIEIGQRLSRCVRPADTVARLGGDEFTVLLADISSVEEAVYTAERIQRALKQPFELRGLDVPISASIGIVSGDLEYETTEDVLRDADIAMYRAKELGRGAHQVFTVEMRERTLSRLALETELRNALTRGELTVHYQPVVSVASGLPVGFEALARWHHPQHGVISPSEFIPIAEEAGIVAEIDLFVLRSACGQLRRWQEEVPALEQASLSVNLSGQGFSAKGLAEQVGRVIAETAFNPTLLKLEITEGILVGPNGAAHETLNELRALGVQLHIDDFGTGYSSLSYLQHLPVSTLKIDRSFVANMTQSRESAELVKTIVTMAQTLGLQVTAEGIETGEQLEQLRSLGCEFGQGYLFSKPLDVAAVAEFMAHQQVKSASANV